MKCWIISYLELVSDVLSSLVLRLFVLQVREGLLCHQLNVGELVPRVWWETLAEFWQFVPGAGVELPDLAGADLYVVSQLLKSEMDNYTSDPTHHHKTETQPSIGLWAKPRIPQASRQSCQHRFMEHLISIKFRYYSPFIQSTLWQQMQTSRRIQSAYIFYAWQAVFFI